MKVYFHRGVLYFAIEYVPKKKKKMPTTLIKQYKIICSEHVSRLRFLKINSEWFENVRIYNIYYIYLQYKPNYGY